MATLDTAHVLVDFDGNLAYLTPTTLEIYDPAGADLGITGILESGSTDLGEPTVDKLLNSVDIDYKGQCNIFFSFENLDGNSFSTSVYTLPYKADRGTIWLHVPLIQRKAFQKISYWLTDPIQGTIIYGIEIDFSVLRRRRES